MPADVLEALFESDRRFFEAGATNDRIGPATLSWIEGLTRVPAGCVAHSVDAARITDPHAWLDGVEDRVRACGWPLVRIYLVEPDVPLQAVLEERGYDRRTELAYATARARRPPEDGVELRHLAPGDDDAWETLAVLHRGSGIGSAIHDADPDEWTELWRRKCASGVLDGYLVTLDGEPCGSVGLLMIGDVLRIKNPLVDRRVRRRAVARSALSLLATTDAGRGCRAITAFVAAGTGGQALVETVGLEEIGTQVEWLRPVP